MDAIWIDRPGRSLLHLPLEIRHKIYHYLFEHKRLWVCGCVEVHGRPDVQPPAEWTTRVRRVNRFDAISIVCHQLRQETLPMIWQDIEIYNCCAPHNRAAVHPIPAHVREKCVKLIVYDLNTMIFNTVGGGGRETSIGKVNELYPNLQHYEILMYYRFISWERRHKRPDRSTDSCYPDELPFNVQNKPLDDDSLVSTANDTLWSFFASGCQRNNHGPGCPTVLFNKQCKFTRRVRAMAHSVDEEACVAIKAGKTPETGQFGYMLYDYWDGVVEWNVKDAPVDETWFIEPIPGVENGGAAQPRCRKRKSLGLASIADPAPGFP